MRLPRFRAKTPKHIDDVFAEMRAMNDEEIEKYAKKSKQEAFDWLTNNTREAVASDVSLDECVATLLGIVLSKSFEVFAVLPPIDLANEEKREHFEDFCHSQGHKLLEMMHHIVKVYTATTIDNTNQV